MIISKKTSVKELPKQPPTVENMAQIREEIYLSVTSCGLFPEEQKGYRKGPKTTGELFYIDQHILNVSTTWQKIPSYGLDWQQKGIWYGPTKLDNKLSRNVQISEEVINFIEKTMKTWWVELTAGGKSLTETKIQRGIFQGDALSQLLSIFGMMPFNHILRKCRAG